jgi:hypothetical protein
MLVVIQVLPLKELPSNNRCNNSLQNTLKVHR